MVNYEKEVLQALRKGALPKEVFKQFRNAFLSLDLTKDLSLFDIKRLKQKENRSYFRLRKGKSRAIFFIQNNSFFVIRIDKREDVYK